MKKVIIGILIVLSIIAAISIFFVVKKHNDSADDDTPVVASEEVLSVLRCQTKQELHNKSDSLGIKLQLYNDGLYEGFDNYSIYDSNFTALFQYDSETVTSIMAKFEFKEDIASTTEADLDILKKCINDSKNICSEIFDADCFDLINIYHNEGYILDGDDAYKELLDGNAQLQFSVKEKSGAFWKIIGYVDEEHFTIYLDRYDNEMFKETNADLVLS